MRYTREELSQPGLDLARELIGATIISELGGERTGGVIVETEAYLGKEDRAAHSCRGNPNGRTRVVYGPGGYAYVHLIYGMYHCLNFVTEPEGEPAAVLVRSVEPVAGTEWMQQLRYGEKPLTAYRLKNFLNGPGKVCQGFSLTRHENGLDLTGDTLFVCDGPEDIGLPAPIPAKERLCSGPRIGVDYAEEARDFPWRFWLEKEV